MKRLRKTAAESVSFCMRTSSRKAGPSFVSMRRSTAVLISSTTMGESDARNTRNTSSKSQPQNNASATKPAAARNSLRTAFSVMNETRSPFSE